MDIILPQLRIVFACNSFRLMAAVTERISFCNRHTEHQNRFHRRI